MPPHKLEGDLLAGKIKIGIVVSRFNDFITSRLVDAAIDTFQRHGGNPDHLTIAYVPGSFEIPTVALQMAKTKKYDALVCLGCVIRGATDHYDYVVQNATKGIGEIPLQTGIPTIFGIITADNLEQAIERAGTKQGNHGAKALLAAIEMANLLKKL